MKTQHDASNKKKKETCIALVLVHQVRVGLARSVEETRAK